MAQARQTTEQGSAREAGEVQQAREQQQPLVVSACVSYNGAPFSGFARQPGQLTVQGELENALQTIFHRRVETTCAGRTDAGVHALGQVVSFELEPDEWGARSMRGFRSSLDALTHDAISIRTVDFAEPGFSARFSAQAREYRYYLCTDSAAPLVMRDFCWQVGGSLDVDAMRQGAQCLIGEHDFKSFCLAVSAEGKPTHRNVMRLEVERQQLFGSNMVVVTVEGNAFLHSMVRTIVGTLVAVGRGRREPGWVAEVLEARDRSAAGENAPAQGLIFWNVRY